MATRPEDDIDYNSEIERAYKDPGDQESRRNAVQEFINAISNYERRAEQPTLGGFLEESMLAGREDQKDDDPRQQDSVTLMTLHSAKGLEFPIVYMVGMEEGLLPHKRSVAEGLSGAEIEEERRLCYVGMTRAQSKLIITGAARRRFFGEYQSTEPSRFLEEIPAELMDRIAPSYSSGYQGAFGHQHYEFRTNPYARGGRGRGGGRTREEAAQYEYENEDQSVSSVRTGMRVRHPQFGVGTVMAVEEHNDDIKVTVRFASVGVKKLLSKYAKLEPA